MTLRQAYFARAEVVPAEHRSAGSSAERGRLPARHPHALPGETPTAHVLTFLREHRRIPIRTRPRRRGPRAHPVPGVDRRLTDTVHLLCVHERGGPPRSLHPPPTAP